jgi:hypothetical protein
MLSTLPTGTSRRNLAQIRVAFVICVAGVVPDNQKYTLISNCRIAMRFVFMDDNLGRKWQETLQ